MPATIGTIDSFLVSADQLHTPPEIARSLLRLTRDEAADISELVDCLQRDPAMSARVLTLVNSSRYGLRCQVSHLGQAVMYLGIRTIRLLALTFSIVETLTKGVARHTYLRYWRRALTTAITASRLADCDNTLNRSQAYTAGLLADLGDLVIAVRDPQRYQLMDHDHQDGDAVAAAERTLLGFDHAELSARLLSAWQFPQPMIDAVATHHRTQDHPDPLGKALNVASLMADVLWHPGSGEVARIQSVLQAGYGLGTDSFIDLATKVKEEIALEVATYGFRLGTPLDCRDILDQARRRYVEASLETAMDLDTLCSLSDQPSPLPAP